MLIFMLIFFGFFYILLFYIFYVIKKAVQMNYIIDDEILIKEGFSNLQKIYENTTAIYYTAIKRGDNYLISVLKENLPSMNNINVLAKEMKDRHYHRGILICISTPAQNLVEYGILNSIEVTTMFELKNSINNIGENSNNIKSDEEYIEIKNDDPIQEPTKSFWNNFFKKPDRL